MNALRILSAPGKGKFIRKNVSHRDGRRDQRFGGEGSLHTHSGKRKIKRELLISAEKKRERGIPLVSGKQKGIVRGLLSSTGRCVAKKRRSVGSGGWSVQERMGRWK